MRGYVADAGKVGSERTAELRTSRTALFYDDSVVLGYKYDDYGEEDMAPTAFFSYIHVCKGPCYCTVACIRVVMSVCWVCVLTTVSECCTAVVVAHV